MPCVLLVRIDVHLHELVGGQNCEADDAGVVLGDPDLALAEQPPDVREILLGRVQPRDVIHPVVRRTHHPRDRRDVFELTTS